MFSVPFLQWPPLRSGVKPRNFACVLHGVALGMRFHVQ